MKTNYRPRNNRASGRKRLTLVATLLVIGTAGFFVLRGPILTGAAPAWKGANALSARIDVWLGLLSSKESLARENELLKQQILSREALIMSLRAVSDSREELLRVYGRTASTTGIAAAVLVHPPETPYDVLVLDAGLSEGVREGQRAFLPEGGLIGNVVQVSSHESRVLMYSSSGVRTDAVLERGAVPVNLQGLGGGNFKIDVPKEVVVVVGDRVIAPGIVGHMIGVVGEVETAPTDSALHARIVSAASVSSVRYVIIK
ncbi:rod shape-determining protein MreC [Candidatus Parcubacteria bacterium]|nr:rod shape-determining protein MreC [Candidatus Parcubacteria bacterium]